MNSLLNDIYRSGVVITAEGEELQALPMGIPQTMAGALYRITRENKAQQTLEIGMAYGLSSLSICQALRDNGGGRHVAIDPWQSTEFKSIGMLNLQKANLADLVDLYEQPSHLVLPDFLQQGRTFDLAFIDGMHLFDYVMLDFFYSLRLIPAGGLIVIDDINIASVASTFAFIFRNLKKLVSVIGRTERFCVLQKLTDDDDRLKMAYGTDHPTHHFKPFESFLDSED